MTNSWTDVRNADVVWIVGGNAAEAHLCGFKWVTEAKAERGAKLMVVDPRFTRSAAVADHYAPIRAGTDIAFLSGVVNYLLTNDKTHSLALVASILSSFPSPDDAEPVLHPGLEPQQLRRQLARQLHRPLGQLFHGLLLAARLEGDRQLLHPELAGHSADRGVE
jgi:anaerobic selenocysteine-containing dehydrogenase